MIEFGHAQLKCAQNRYTDVENSLYQPLPEDCALKRLQENLNLFLALRFSYCSITHIAHLILFTAKH